MIEVLEVNNRKDFNEFFSFPHKLYKDCKQWVPPIISEEKIFLIQKKNSVFDHALARLFLAKKNGEVVGRIAAMINWIEIEEQNKSKVRFGWYDTIDDISVSEMLIKAVEGVAIAEDMKFIEGPMGFSNMDKAGLLVDGYEHMNTMITWYHYPYQKEHLENLDWLRKVNGLNSKYIFFQKKKLQKR